MDKADELLLKYGLEPDSEKLPELVEILDHEVEHEMVGQGKGDTEIIRLICVQLFNTGDPAHVLKIWKAKRSSGDANFAIEVDLLLGAGIARTLAWLKSHETTEANNALAYIQKIEALGELEGFTIDACSEENREYYGVG